MKLTTVEGGGRLDFMREGEWVGGWVGIKRTSAQWDTSINTFSAQRGAWHKEVREGKEGGVKRSRACGVCRSQSAQLDTLAQSFAAIDTFSIWQGTAGPDVPRGKGRRLRKLKREGLQASPADTFFCLTFTSFSSA